MFADSNRFGLTPCAPILKQREANNYENADFYGALCLDQDPSGPLAEYFPFNKTEGATYLIFTPDEAFISVTEIEDSQFVDLV